MALFKHLLRKKSLTQDEQHIVPVRDRGNYPSFAADFATLDDVLMPTFHILDNEALRQQTRYRRLYLILIFGGGVTTILSIVQLAFQSADWPGLVGAFIAAILVGSTAMSRSFNYQERYLHMRLAAEKLRGIYFLFLERHHPYEHDQDREQHLRRDVKEIRQKGEQVKSMHSETVRRPWREKGKTMSQGNTQEFFKLYQEHRYKHQHEFYSKKKQMFERAQTRTAWISIILMSLTALASGVGSDTSIIIWLRLACLLVAAIFPVCSTISTSYSNLYGFEHHAKLYDDALANLAIAEEEVAPESLNGLDEAQFRSRLEKYVHEVEDVFRREHSQWGQLVEKLKLQD